MIEWMPLTYFVAIGILSMERHETDPNGCSMFANKCIESIMVYVFLPVITLRILGTLFMNKTELIIYQLFIIYGYLLVSLFIWEVNTLEGIKEKRSECIRPVHVSILNLIAMSTFYMFYLTPFFTFFLMLPWYFYAVYKHIHQQRQRGLVKHYLIKAMPSIIFDKKLFKENNYLECGICMEPFEEGYDYVTPLACDARHFYHSDCIEEWLT